MTTKNDITGDSLISKKNSDAFRNNFDDIFKKKEPVNPDACLHEQTKMKLVAWATDTASGIGHRQGFTMQRCCAYCGIVMPEKDNAG